ncbi:MAG: membrane protein insertion efficiency factor YidD [Saprospiraceae bacterium]|nr:membrane protein insertion efficiency factor YidD [Saprospiraceae bacterium]
MKITMLLSIVLFALTGLSAQNSEDLGFARVLAAEKHKPGAYTTFKEHIQGNQNEIQTVFSALFFMYKEVLSSQDANRCAFYPSCSLYGIMAVKQQGLIKGGIMTLDRLTRCNGLSPEKYEIDTKKRALVDPVKW